MNERMKAKKETNEKKGTGVERWKKERSNYTFYVYQILPYRSSCAIR
jgi:hypothetical protein